MALWMNRAGRRGESEPMFLANNRIYLQWQELDHDLGSVESKDEMRDLLIQTYPDAPVGRIRSYLGQIWTFVKLMQPGDWVGLPSKLKRVIHFGEITSNYLYDSKQEPAFRQSRNVKWFAPDIPRSSIPQEILYMFGAQTVCRIDADTRIRALATSG